MRVLRGAGITLLLVKNYVIEKYIKIELNTFYFLTRTEILANTILAPSEYCSTPDRQFIILADVDLASLMYQLI